MYETEGTFFNVSGWGDSETLEGSFQDGSDILKVTQIPFVPKSQCHLPKGRSGQRGKSKICAGGIPGTRESGINCILWCPIKMRVFHQNERCLPCSLLPS